MTRTSAGSQTAGRTLASVFKSGGAIGIVAVCLAWAGTAGAQGPLGMVIGDPVVLNTNAASDSESDWSPQVTTDGAGNWVAVWWSTEDLGGTAGTDEDIFVARSTDNGQTWSAPATLNTNAASDSKDDFNSGWDYNPQVTTDGAGHWVTVWQSTEKLGGAVGTDWDIFVSRSTDNGQTWSTLTTLNTNAASDLGADRYPQVTTDGAGNWIAVWRSEEPLSVPGGTAGWDWDIFVARSTDNGESWSAPAVLNTNAASDLGADYEPQVTTDGAGNWVAVWHSHDDLGGTVGPDADIFVARSTDNGQSWSAPATLNTNAASDSTTFDSGGDFRPQVTTDGTGNWVAVWDSGGYTGTEADIFVARSTDNGQTWSAPAMLNAASASGTDWNPQVTTDGAGNWVAVWDSGERSGTDGDIFVARSTDNGQTWSAPAALNTIAASGSGDDYYPQVATDGAGNWVTVWDSDESLGSTIGTDADIFSATWFLAPAPLTSVKNWILYK
jgi:Neuraminidase (sialidase)